jgi:NAD(P)H-binding
LNGWDAVVSSLGTGLSPFREVSLQTVATRAIVTAMARNGVRRLVSISALAVGGQPSRRLRARQLTRLGRRPARHAYQ